MAYAIKNEVVKASAYLFIALNIYNFLNYLFQFISARMLGAEGYSNIAVFMGVVYLLIIPSASILTIVSRYTTFFSASGRKGDIATIIRKASLKFIKIGAVMFFLLTVLSPFIGRFLKVNIGIIILSAFLGGAMLILSVYRGALQGMKRFREFGISYLTEGASKVILAVLLISFFGVIGAVMGYVASFFISLGVSFFFIKDILKEKSRNGNISGIYNYSFPVLATLAGITLLYSIDLIIAKRFFPDDIAGKYAAIAMLGKAIFFATSPISLAAFPFMSEHYDAKKNGKSPMGKAMLIILLICSIAMLFYAIMPDFIINILFGKEYTEFSQYLIYTGLSMSLLSISNMFAYYNLSNKNYNSNYLIILAVVLQIILMSIFNNTIMQFILAFLFSQIFLLILMAFNYYINMRERK